MFNRACLSDDIHYEFSVFLSGVANEECSDFKNVIAMAAIQQMVIGKFPEVRIIFISVKNTVDNS